MYHKLKVGIFIDKKVQIINKMIKDSLQQVFTQNFDHVDHLEASEIVNMFIHFFDCAIFLLYILMTY